MKKLILKEPYDPYYMLFTSATYKPLATLSPEILDKQIQLLIGFGDETMRFDRFLIQTMKNVIRKLLLYCNDRFVTVNFSLNPSGIFYDTKENKFRGYNIKSKLFKINYIKKDQQYLERVIFQALTRQLIQKGTKQLFLYDFSFSFDKITKQMDGLIVSYFQTDAYCPFVVEGQAPVPDLQKIRTFYLRQNNKGFLEDR